MGELDKETASRWRLLIERQLRSGQTQMEFCRERGIALSTFALWKRRLKAPAHNRSAFIPVQIQDESSVSAMPRGAWACEIVGPRVKIRLRERPESASLRDLLSVVAGEA
jgi:hypothetical protein